MQEDVRQTGESRVPDAQVLHARQEMLFESFAEVKRVLKTVEETVAIFRVFDMQIKQQGLDMDRLTRVVDDLHQRLNDMGPMVEKSINVVRADLSEEIEKAQTTANEVGSKVSNKLSWIQGAVAAVTFLGAIMYGFGVWWGGRYVDIIENGDRYIHTLKTLQAEEHLRSSLGDKPRIEQLENPPVVTRDNGRRL